MKKTKAERFLEEFNDIDDKFLKEAEDYTMKKRFNFKPIIAVAACAALALAAVPAVNHFVNTPAVGTQGGSVPAGEDVLFNVYEYGVHASETIGTHKIEVQYNPGRTTYISDNMLGTKKTINLMGKEWTAEYESTQSETDFQEKAYEYSGTSNGKKIKFMVNAVTGKCEFFRFDFGENTDDVKLTEKELYEIAYKHLMNDGYVEDPENYAISFVANQGSLGYAFEFSRFINGIQTSERIDILLKNNGEFYCYMGHQVGEMKNVDVSHIDMDKFYDAVDAKFKTIYGNDYVGFEREGGIYTRLRNGSYVFRYDPCVNVKNKNGEIIDDKCFFYITMEK